MSLITAETAARLALGMTARCTFIKRSAWANDGQTLIVAHGSGLSIWIGGFDARPNHVFASEAPVRAVAASTQAQLVAVAGHDGRIRLWNSETWQRDRGMPLQMHKAAVTAIAFHPKRLIVASGDGYGWVFQVDLDSGRFMKLAGHRKEVTGIAYSADGGLLATGSWDGEARVWSAITGALLHTLPHDQWVRSLGFSPAGNRLATACRDGILRMWGTADGTLLSETSAHEGGMDALAWSPDGTVIVTGGREGALRLWDATTLAPLAAVEHAHNKPILTLAFRPQGDFLISGGGDNWLHLWETPDEAGAPASD